VDLRVVLDPSKSKCDAGGKKSLRSSRQKMSRYTSSATSRNDTARRRADVGKWVTSARKRTKVTGGGGLVLPDYFVSHETDATTSNGVGYDIGFGWVLDAAAIQARSDYASLLLGVEAGKYLVHFVYVHPVDGFVRRYSMGNFGVDSNTTVPLGTPSASAYLPDVGVVGQDTVIQYRLELVGFETEMAFARTANEGEYSHTLTLPAYNPPDITTAALPVPQYLYGSSPSDVGIHDKKITVTIVSGDFPAPDYPSSANIYHIYIEMETYTQSAWGNNVSATIKLFISGLNLQTTSAVKANLFPLDLTPYTPRRLRYKVTSGSYTKTGGWSQSFCYPPKFFPDTSAGTGITVGFDYATLKFTSHKLRVTNFTATGADSTASMQLRTRHQSPAVNYAELLYSGAVSTASYDYASTTAVSTPNPYALSEGQQIATTGGQVDVMFSVAPDSWHPLVGGPISPGAYWTEQEWLTIRGMTADARARLGFRNEWLDFTSDAQTVLTVPSVTAFNMDWQLNGTDKSVWDMSVESFTASGWPAGNFADFRFGVTPYRHTTIDGGIIDYTSFDKPLQLGKFTDKTQVYADKSITEPLGVPPRNYRWSYQYLRMNNDNYHYLGNLNRIIYTAPKVYGLNIATVPAGTTGAGYSVQVTAFDGTYTAGFVAGDKATYDLDIYVSVTGAATTPDECEVGPISASLSPTTVGIFPVTIYTFDRTATTPYKWGDSYVTDDSAQTHKVFVVVGYTPNPANGEPTESMSKIGPLATASVSGVAVAAIPPPPGVLESYASSVLPSLNGAYSPRRLFSAYTGPTMLIRRDTDNKQGEVSVDASGDISSVYDPIALTFTSFADWVAGATVIEPVVLYDQSGNGNNATLASATARSATNFMHFDSTEMTWTGGDATGAGNHYYILPNDTVPIGDLSYTLLAHHGDLYHAYSQFVSAGQTSTRMFNGLSRGSATVYVNNWWSSDVSGGTVVTTGAVVAAAYNHVTSERKVWTPANGNGTWVNWAADRVEGSHACWIGKQGSTLFMRCQLKTILIANAVLSDADIAGIQVALEA